MDTVCSFCSDAILSENGTASSTACEHKFHTKCIIDVIYNTYRSSLLCPCGATIWERQIYTGSVWSTHSQDDHLEQCKANPAFKEDVKKIRAKITEYNKAIKNLNKLVTQTKDAWKTTIHESVLFIKSAKEAAVNTIKEDPSFKDAKAAVAGRLRLFDAFTNRWNLSSYTVNRRLFSFSRRSSRLSSLTCIQNRHFTVRV
jgi:hypothetical protein